MIPTQFRYIQDISLFKSYLAFDSLQCQLVIMKGKSYISQAGSCPFSILQQGMPIDVC